MDNREDFLNGKFHISQVVRDDLGLYEVLHIGTNYLTVIDSTNKISKKWPDKIQETSESLVIDYFKTENSALLELRPKFIESLYEFQLGKFNDKLGLITAWNKLEEYFINNNEDNITKVRDIFKNINQTDKFKGILEMYQDNKPASADEKLSAAKIWASIFSEEITEGCTPEEAVNSILSKHKVSEQELVILESLKSDFGIEYDTELVEKLDISAAEQTDPNTDTSHPLHPEPNLSDHEQVDGTHIDFSDQKDDELNNISDEEIDQIIATHLHPDDFFEDYPEDQLCVVDEDDGCKKLESEVNEEALNEVLSRMERMRASIRFHRSSAKRERKLKIALVKKSDTKTIMHRARRLAVKALELRIARKPLATLTVSEKERIEARISKAKPILNRMTVRLIQRVKKLEQQRLHEGFDSNENI